MKSRECLRHQKAHSPCSFANFTIVIHFDIVHMHMNMCSAHFWHASWTYPLILKLLEAFVLAMRVEAWTWTVEINKTLGYTQTPATSVLIYWDSSTKAIYQGPIPTLKMQQIHSIPFRHDSIVEFVVLAEVKCEASFDGSAVCQTYTQQYGGWLWRNWNATLKYYIEILQLSREAFWKLIGTANSQAVKVNTLNSDKLPGRFSYKWPG